MNQKNYHFNNKIMKQCKTIKKYGIFRVNQSRYRNDGAGKLEQIDGYGAIMDTEEEAIKYISDTSDTWVDTGVYVVTPVYVKEIDKEWQREQDAMERFCKSVGKSISERDVSLNTENNNGVRPRTFSISNHGVRITDNYNTKK